MIGHRPLAFGPWLTEIQSHRWGGLRGIEAEWGYLPGHGVRDARRIALCGSRLWRIRSDRIDHLGLDRSWCPHLLWHWMRPHGNATAGHCYAWRRRFSIADFILIVVIAAAWVSIALLTGLAATYPRLCWFLGVLLVVIGLSLRGVGKHEVQVAGQ